MRVARVDAGPAAVGCVVALSFAVLAVAFDLGTVVFYRRGHRPAALAHGVAGLGWTLLVAGPLLGSVALVWLGTAVVVGGAAFLVVDVYRGA